MLISTNILHDDGIFHIHTRIPTLFMGKKKPVKVWLHIKIYMEQIQLTLKR